MEEKDIKEVDRILEKINRSERKYGEIILVVKNGEVRFIDFRGSIDVFEDLFPGKTINPLG